jgi:hypothetical protein
MSQVSFLYPGENIASFATSTRAELEGWVNRSAHPTPELSPISPETTSHPSRDHTIARFVIWQHTIDNAAQLPGYIQGCSVVALESSADQRLSASEQRKQERIEEQHDAVLNLWTGADLTDEERSIVKPWLDLPLPDLYAHRKKYVKETLPIYKEYEPLIKSLMNSGTRVQFVDTRLQHVKELYKFLNVEKRAESMFLKVAKTTMVYEELAQKFVDLRRAMGATLAYRDRISTKQLGELCDTHQGDQVAAVYGAAHLALERRLRIAKPEIDTSLAYVPLVTVDKKALLIPVDATLSALFSIGLKPPAELVQEALTDYMAYWLLDEVDGYFALSTEDKLVRTQKIAELWKFAINHDDPMANVKRSDRLEKTALILQT